MAKKKKNKNLIWIIIGIVLVLAVAIGFGVKYNIENAAASQNEYTQLMPSDNSKCRLFEQTGYCNVQKEYCNDDGTVWYRDDLDCLSDGEHIGEVCFENRICLDTIVMNCGMGAKLEFCDLYCNLEQWKQCPDGCDESFRCKGDIIGCNNPVGSVDDQTCINGDVYECEVTSWNKIEECGDFQCVEESYNYARCKTDIYYCISNGVTCTRSSNPNCYKTLDECKNNIVYYCLSEDGTKCTKRFGGCLDGELENLGSDESAVKKQCESRICGKEDSVCCEGNKCDEGLTCEKQEGKTYADGSPVYECKSQICENMSVYNPLRYWCFFVKWWNKLITTITIIATIIASLFGLLFGIKLAVEMAHLKGYSTWIIGAILGATLGYLTYLYWWLILILVTVGSILYVMIPKIKR